MELNNLVFWLKFDKSPTDDFIKDNHWTIYGNPIIGTTNAINGNALQLDGNSYLKLSGVYFGGNDFTIDGWVYVDSASPDYARIITIVNPSNNYHLLSVRKNSDDPTKLDFWRNSRASVNYNSTGSAVVAKTESVGKRVHFRITKRTVHSTPALCLSIDGAYQDYTYCQIEYDWKNYDIYIGANSDGSQGLIGSIDELHFYSGVNSAYDFTPPTAEFYNNLTYTFNIDTLKKIANPPLTWRYENPGTADLLLTGGTTVTNLDKTQSKTGTAFYQSTQAKSFDIPNCKELWIKCDIYTTASYTTNDRIRIYSKDSNGVNGWNTNSSITSNYILWHNGNSVSGASYLGKNKNRPFLLHMISDATNGLIEYFFSSGDSLRWTGNVNGGNDFANVYIQMDGSNILVSNLIISNAPLELTDDVTETTTDIELAVDTLRNVKNNIELSVDTTRRILQGVWKRNFPKFDESEWEVESTLEIPSTDEVWLKFLLITDYHDDFVYEDFQSTSLNIGYLSAIWNEDEDSYVAYGLDIFQNDCAINDDHQTQTATLRKRLEENVDENCVIHLKSGVTNGLVEVFFDGILAGTYTGNVNNGENFDNVHYSRETTYHYIRNLIVSNAPLGENDNAQFPVEIYFDTLRILGNKFEENICLTLDTLLHIKKSLELALDTKRVITLSNVWRYENYGTADLLAVEGTTIDNLTKYDALYQTAFYSLAERQNYFDLLPTNEVWIKFDFYFTAIYESLYFGSLDNATYNQVRLNCAGSSGEQGRLIFANGTNVQADLTNQFLQKKRYRAVLHLKSGSDDGLIEFLCSDGYNLSYTGNVNNGDDFENIYIQAGHSNNMSAYPYVSNVIISNGEVGLNENAKMPLTVQYDLLRTIYKTFEFQTYFDLCRNVVKSQTLNADLLREIYKTFEFNSDTCRTLNRNVQIDFDTARVIPHKIHAMPIPLQDFSVPSENHISEEMPSTENISMGIRSIEIILSAQQLTDQINYVTINPAVIMQTLKGQYLDYVFSMRIEQIRKRGVLYYYKCCSDIDELLYKQLDYKIPEDEEWHRTDSSSESESESESEEEEETEEELPMSWASTHVSHIAEVIGKTPLLFFADFVSTADTESGGLTYQDLISNIFGWTSRVPNMLINVFLRDDKLFVVQRGHEPNTIDITNVKHSIPLIDCELVRTAWGATVWSKTETREAKEFNRDYLKPKPLTVDHGSDSGDKDDDSSKDGKTSWNYGDSSHKDSSKDLIYNTKIHHADGSYTEVQYQYETSASGQIYLVAEIARTYEGGELVDEQTTIHQPAPQGQNISHTEDSEGNYLGSSLGKTTDQRNTPFNNRKNKESNIEGIRVSYVGLPSKEMWIKWQEERTIHGLSLFDTSFPVHGDEKLAEITAHINWLNRKTLETVSMSIYDYPHVIDFTDKIIFEGNTYYLESNTITTNNRIVNRQDVVLVRWY